jgi:hypothetical protein
MKKVDKVSNDIEAGLVVLTESQHGPQHGWALSEPDEKGLRTVYFDGEEKGRGVLLGTISPMALGYMTRSPDIEVGRSMGIEFPDGVWGSTPITAIIVMAEEKVLVK